MGSTTVILMLPIFFSIMIRLSYSLPDDIFNAEDRLYIFLAYNGKNSLNFLDHLQWIWIKKKMARIKRHTEKKALKMKEDYHKTN